MKLAFKLAFKNLIGGGLRTWLNVIVLSFAFVIIILYNGFLDGWNEQASNDAIDWEVGQGQYLNDGYDPYDMFSIIDGYGTIPNGNLKNTTPVLLRQGSIYPHGRGQAIVLKGISANQTLLKLPTHLLAESDAAIPILIGKRLAKSAQLEKGEQVLVRWRDKNGTYDAANATIVGVFDTNVATIDNGQIWMDIEKLWELTEMQNQASYLIASNDDEVKVAGWHFADLDYLLKDIHAAVATERIGSMVLFLALLLIALLAIFDTQVLSIFRRQKEIGTYIALGMTRKRVVWLFTIEGMMYSIFATVVGSLYGIPIFSYIANIGIGMADMGEDVGVAMASRIFPIYGVRLILGVAIIVVISATIVSFMPARKIAHMNPVDALKGKMQ